MLLRLVPIVILTILIGPVLAGLAGIVAPALGYLPVLGGEQLTLHWFDQAAMAPGFARSAWISYWTGLATSAISLLLVVLFLAGWWGTRWFTRLASATAPLFAVPHAAAAIGLAFLIAPSGWLVRLFSPWATGFSQPPDWLIVNDPAGFALLAGLVIKEIPFLLLMALAALPQSDARRRVRAARSLGYGRVWGWLSSVFPSVYAQIRLPVYAVVAYATSVVDVAIILGPTAPPPLAVQILRWQNDPDLTLRFTAAAGAMLQLAVTGGALITWWLGERTIAAVGRSLLTRGWRLSRDFALRAAALAGIGLSALLVIGGAAVLALWSVAGLWQFPEILPDMLTVDHWLRHAGMIGRPTLTALQIGLASAAIALLLVLGAVENAYRRGITPTQRVLALLYIPLIVPQISFLFGLILLVLRAGIDGTFWAVVIAHLVFVIPYVYLALADPYAAFDSRYLAVARGLGKSPARAFFTIRLPMMMRAILTAFAFGFAVSIAQYLPTVMIGAGRLPTVTTEAVALAAGGDRRVLGAFALIQSALPIVAFLAAAWVPAIFYRRRRALKGAGARI